MVHGKYDIVILERLDQLFGGVFSITKPFTGSNEDIALGALIRQYCIGGWVPE